MRDRKFTNYIFKEGNSKKALFESWGYSIIDSQYLKKEIESQAKIAYATGDYILGRLDAFGQRISVQIVLQRPNNKGEVTFLSGWMVYPNGKILLTTPYGGE